MVIESSEPDIVQQERPIFISMRKNTNDCKTEGHKINPNGYFCEYCDYELSPKEKQKRNKEKRERKMYRSLYGSERAYSLRELGIID